MYNLATIMRFINFENAPEGEIGMPRCVFLGGGKLI